MTESVKEIPNGKSIVDITETPEEYKGRIRSLIIVYFTLFLQSLGLAIAMTGLYPYLIEVN